MDGTSSTHLSGDAASSSDEDSPFPHIDYLSQSITQGLINNVYKVYEIPL